MSSRNCQFYTGTLHWKLKSRLGIVNLNSELGIENSENTYNSNIYGLSLTNIHS